jgi:MAE_28990/MAE_18760-like HEPN
MFESYHLWLCQQVEAVEDALCATDAARDLLSTRHFHPLLISNGAARDAALQLKYRAPDPTAWRTFDHAAAVTSLYASYERFVYDLLGDWLALVPSFYPNYNDLPSSVEFAHRDGIGSNRSRAGVAWA